MTPNDLRAKLRAQPFEAFRIVMNNGERLEVRHPEFANVTMSAVYVFPSGRNGGDIPAGPPTVCSLRNIATLEPMTGTAA